MPHPLSLFNSPLTYATSKPLQQAGPCGPLWQHRGTRAAGDWQESNPEHTSACIYAARTCPAARGEQPSGARPIRIQTVHGSAAQCRQGCSALPTASYATHLTPQHACIRVWICAHGYTYGGPDPCSACWQASLQTSVGPHHTNQLHAFNAFNASSQSCCTAGSDVTCSSMPKETRRSSGKRARAARMLCV